jgi:uncharacterized repeat protein (TIGR03806 family)
MRALLPAFSIVLLAAGCGDNEAPPATAQKLSDFGLFVGDGHTQEPAPGVIPYEVISPLYSDGAVKHRFLKLPAGAKIHYSDTDRWDMPVGTILIKTFAFPIDARDPSKGEHLIETRLLIREASGWTAHTFAWNDAQTEAFSIVAGKHVPISYIDATGATVDLDYHLPNTNQCQNCHGKAPDTHLLGPRTRQLNRLHDYGDGMGPVNQIDHLDALGLLDVTPLPADQRPTITDYNDTSATPEARARAYLEANCAHCHTEGGYADDSGLHVGLDELVPVDLGICRHPFSSGNLPDGYKFDIQPAHPEQSVMIYRMSSTDPEIKMPEIPTVTSDANGVAIVSAWISSMADTPCP